MAKKKKKKKLGEMKESAGGQKTVTKPQMRGKY